MKILLRMAVEARKYKWLLITSIVSTLLLTGVNLIAPRLLSRMTALVTAGLNDQGLNEIFLIAVVLFVLYLSRILFRFLSNYMAHKAAWFLVEELRMRVYNTLQSHSMEFFRKQRSGDLVSRVVTDTSQFEQLYAHIMPDAITSTLTVLGVTVILFSINAQLALLTCVPLPFIFFAGRYFIKKVRPNFRVVQRSRGDLSAQLQDNFSGIQEIQAFGQQEEAAKKAHEKAHTFTTAMLYAIRRSALFQPGVEFLNSMGTIAVVAFGGFLAYQNQLAASDIVAFLLYLTLFYAPLSNFAQLFEHIQNALASAERVIEVLDYPDQIVDKPSAKPLENPQGRLQFEHVNFSYTPEIPILSDITFDIQPGQMVALVGATGVGKTTLTQLIARFYDPTAGSIQMDGLDLRDIQLASLRQNIAMVLQDTFLFNGTIAENIAFAKPHASQEQIEHAARISRIHDDILAMTEGYQTIVGERGARLSGGQKQRIAIARAVLCEAPILILDEATASVDVQTEADIQQAIQDLTGTRTIVAIAHRLSTVRRADRILVFEEGRITQSGTHDELIAQPGLYQHMCRVQERGAQLSQIPAGA